MRVVLVVVVLVVLVVLPHENKVKPNCQSSVRVGWSCWLELSVGLGLGFDKNASLLPLRVNWWGQKHIGSSYFCELSLHTEFQSPSTYPSGRKVKSWRERKKKRINGENNGYLLYVDTSGARANFANPEPPVQQKSLEIFIEKSPPPLTFSVVCDTLDYAALHICLNLL